MRQTDRQLTIVTGGSRGIGAATALQLAIGGHDVALAYHEDAEAAERVRVAVCDAGARCVAIRGDVTRESDVERLFAAASELGTVTGLVNNAGMTAFTAGLAKEVAAESIRVNAVAPGIVATGIHARAGVPDRAERAAARIPLGRAADPAEIVPAIVWLLSPAATYATGTIIRVAGGI